MNSVVNVVRLQLVNKQGYVLIPLMVLGAALLMTLIIFSLVPLDGPKYAYGATFAPLWAFAIVGSQALTATFPFSQALSVTRRDFHLGALAAASLSSVMLALIYLVIALIERATNGWGTNGHFALPGLGGDVPTLAFLGYFVIAMLFFVLGYFNTAIQQRWGTTALIAVLSVGALVLTAAVALITRAGAWAALGTWFVGQGALSLILWGFALTALLAGGAYLIMRRIVQ